MTEVMTFQKDRQMAAQRKDNFSNVNDYSPDFFFLEEIPDNSGTEMEEYLEILHNSKCIIQE